MADGLGSELMELCVYFLSVNGLRGVLSPPIRCNRYLADMVGLVPHAQPGSLFHRTRRHPAGRAGRLAPGTRMFTAQQLLDLPGTTLVLRLDTWHTAPSVFPECAHGPVTAMSIALVTVVGRWCATTDAACAPSATWAMRWRFRKAMEDSLVTGLRARGPGRPHHLRQPCLLRDGGLHGARVAGLQHHRPLPRPVLAPPERVEEYRQRQAHRFAGSVPPREGFESEFMRKDGTRFPVLIIEAPLINAQGLHTGWMSAFRTSANSAGWKSFRALRRSACRPPPAWPRWARWPRCSATS